LLLLLILSLLFWCCCSFAVSMKSGPPFCDPPF